MSSQQFDDETLMAFADGELDEETTARVEAAMETDDELVMRVATFIESRAAVASELKPLIDEPVPEALTRSVEAMVAASRQPKSEPAQSEKNVVHLRPARRSTHPSWVMPLAASLAAVAFGVGGYLAGQANAPGTSAPSLAGIADTAMVRTLDTAASGTEAIVADGSMKLVSSFRDGGGTLCREFELKQAGGAATVTVACRDGQEWSLRLAVAGPAASTGAYQPAGATETVDAFLTTIGAGAPLSEADEKAALARQ